MICEQSVVVSLASIMLNQNQCALYLHRIYLFLLLLIVFSFPSQELSILLRQGETTIYTPASFNIISLVTFIHYLFIIIELPAN